MPDIATLPPRQIDIPSAWVGETMAANADRWLVQLSAADIAEIEGAATSFLAAGKDIGAISKDAFPLPRFGSHLANLQKILI